MQIMRFPLAGCPPPPTPLDFYPGIPPMGGRCRDFQRPALSTRRSSRKITGQNLADRFHIWVCPPTRAISPDKMPPSIVFIFYGVLNFLGILPYSFFFDNPHFYGSPIGDRLLYYSVCAI